MAIFTHAEEQSVGQIITVQTLKCFHNSEEIPCRFAWYNNSQGTQCYLLDKLGNPVQRTQGINDKFCIPVSK